MSSVPEVLYMAKLMLTGSMTASPPRNAAGPTQSPWSGGARMYPVVLALSRSLTPSKFWSSVPLLESVSPAITGICAAPRGPRAGLPPRFARCDMFMMETPAAAGVGAEVMFPVPASTACPLIVELEVEVEREEPASRSATVACATMGMVPSVIKLAASRTEPARHGMCLRSICIFLIPLNRARGARSRHNVSVARPLPRKGGARPTAPAEEYPMLATTGRSTCSVPSTPRAIGATP